LSGRRVWKVRQSRSRRFSSLQPTSRVSTFIERRLSRGVEERRVNPCDGPQDGVLGGGLVSCELEWVEGQRAEELVEQRLRRLINSILFVLDDDRRLRFAPSRFAVANGSAELRGRVVLLDSDALRDLAIRCVNRVTPKLPGDEVFAEVEFNLRLSLPLPNRFTRDGFLAAQGVHDAVEDRALARAVLTRDDDDVALWGNLDSRDPFNVRGREFKDSLVSLLLQSAETYVNRLVASKSLPVTYTGSAGVKESSRASRGWFRGPCERLRCS